MSRKALPLLAATAALLLLFAAGSAGARTPRSGAYSGTVDGGFKISFHVSGDHDEVVGLQTNFEPTLCPGIPPSSDPEEVKFPAAKLRGTKFNTAVDSEKLSGTFKDADEVIGTVSIRFKVAGNPEPCHAEGEFTAKRR